MANKRKLDQAFAAVALISTATSLLVGVASAGFRDLVGTSTGQMLGQIEFSSNGQIRPEYVASQVALFVWTWAVLSLLIGFGLAGAHRLVSAAAARAIAADRVPSRAPSAGYAVFVVICFLLGIYLPQAIFQPTNDVELGRQLALAAWALRSWLGGVVLGVLILVSSVAAAFLIYWAFVIVPRSYIAKSYQRIMENA